MVRACRAILILLLATAVAGAAPRLRDRPVDVNAFRKHLVGDWTVEVAFYPEEQHVIKGLTFSWRFGETNALEIIDSGQVEQFLFQYRVSAVGGQLRLDLFGPDDKGGREVRPGIARLDGDRLIWVQARYPSPERDVTTKDGDIRTRPRTFSPSKEGEGIRLVLVRDPGSG